MRILLDECVTKRLKTLLPNHDVTTVPRMGWSGLKNGKLLAKVEEEGFDILLTIDKNIKYQQNIGNRAIILVILDAKSSKIEDIAPLLPVFEQQLTKFEKGNAYLIN